MEEILSGGNMNAPVRIGNGVHRSTTDSTETIHRLLNHLRIKGISWIPSVMGFDKSGREVLSYISGDVPHDMPDWIWQDYLLRQIAHAMKQLHDATTDFCTTDAKWAMEASDPIEVICHNDFAPYNCVFQDGEFKGLFDFDMCSPGSRLWDMAYTAYRFIPLMPEIPRWDHDERSPFTKNEMLIRTELFLDSYAGKEQKLRYSIGELLNEASKRLIRLSRWTADFGNKTNNEELMNNAKMYEYHSQWIFDQI